jgi:hypothetical protein
LFHEAPLLTQEKLLFPNEMPTCAIQGIDIGDGLTRYLRIQSAEKRFWHRINLKMEIYPQVIQLIKISLTVKKNYYTLHAAWIIFLSAKIGSRNCDYEWLSLH